MFAGLDAGDRLVGGDRLGDLFRLDRDPGEPLQCLDVVRAQPLGLDELQARLLHVAQRGVRIGRGQAGARPIRRGFNRLERLLQGLSRPVQLQEHAGDEFTALGIRWGRLDRLLEERQSAFEIARGRLLAPEDVRGRRSALRRPGDGPAGSPGGCRRFHGGRLDHRELDPDFTDSHGAELEGRGSGAEHPLVLVVDRAVPPPSDDLRLRRHQTGRFERDSEEPALLGVDNTVHEEIAPLVGRAVPSQVLVVFVDDHDLRAGDALAVGIEDLADDLERALGAGRRGGDQPQTERNGDRESHSPSRWSASGRVPLRL